MHRQVSAFLFLFFFIGQAIHAGLQASSIIASPSNGISSYAQYVKVNGFRVASRFFIAYCIFSLWEWHGPELFAAIAQFAPGGLTFITAHPDPIPLNDATAGLFGFFSDSIMETVFGLATRKYPGLQKYFPPEPGPASQTITTIVSATATSVDKITQVTTKTEPEVPK